MITRKLSNCYINILMFHIYFFFPNLSKEISCFILFQTQIETQKEVVISYKVTLNTPLRKKIKDM